MFPYFPVKVEVLTWIDSRVLLSVSVGNLIVISVFVYLISYNS